jgi:phosphoribosylglycinamide formyltransferase-1
VRAYKNKILNIHPALLPAFKGAHAIADAFFYGAKVTGVTVHFVDEEMDHGPIVLQEAVAIEDTDSAASLEDKIHKVEHALYPAAIQRVLSKKCAVRGRRVTRIYSR